MFELISAIQILMNLCQVLVFLFPPIGHGVLQNAIVKFWQNFHTSLDSFLGLCVMPARRESGTNERERFFCGI